MQELCKKSLQNRTYFLPIATLCRNLHITAPRALPRGALFHGLSFVPIAIPICICQIFCRRCGIGEIFTCKIRPARRAYIYGTVPPLGIFKCHACKILATQERMTPNACGVTGNRNACNASLYPNDEIMKLYGKLSIAQMQANDNPLTQKLKKSHPQWDDFFRMQLFYGYVTSFFAPGRSR